MIGLIFLPVLNCFCVQQNSPGLAVLPWRDSPELPSQLWATPRLPPRRTLNGALPPQESDSGCYNTPLCAIRNCVYQQAQVVGGRWRKLDR